MLLLYITAAFISHSLGFPRRIPIGGIFDSDEMIQRAFEISIKAVNKNITVSEDAMDVLLTPRTEKINKNPFHVAKIACKLVNSGIAGIFGPQNKLTANYVQSMCDTLDIPYITAKWDSESKRSNVINLYPHPDVLSMVFQDLIKEYKWEEYAILYDNTDGLIRMTRLLKLNSISAMAYHLGSGANFSRRAIKKVKRSDYRNIIIDCSYDILASVLEQALQVGILSEKYNVIVTSLDLQTLDLEPYQYSGVNITGVRLINPESSIVQRTLQFRSLNWNLTNGSHLKVEAALAYDAVQLFAKGYARLRDSVNGNTKKLFCNRTEIWGHGFSLSNYMRSEQINGLSGVIKFDTAGFRSEFQLDIVSLKNQGLRKIGRWETNIGIQWKPEHRIPGVDDEKTLRDKHFLVLISLTDPYGMLKESANMTIGNDRYEGFGIDIIHEMSKILAFNYTFEAQADNVYGSLNEKSGQWNGMLGKIIAGTADLAITDLTITAERQNAVDFTSPFMNLGISILYRKPTSAPPSLLSFLGPFSKDVWVHLIAAYIVVSILLFVIGKLCPVEWTNPYPCIEEPQVLKTPFTFLDTPFFVIGALLKSPTGFAPAGISTRTLAIAWWFFTLIITSTYTANLAAALSTKSVVRPFETAEELAAQQKIKYGAKKGGSTLSFFKDSSHKSYQTMFNYMMAHADDVLMGTNEEGVWKVQQENYAYLMESSSIEYIKQRKCNVTGVGGLLDAKNYGIAMRKDAPYHADLSGAILKLSENGVINELYDKWWKRKRGGDECKEKIQVKVEALNFEDVKGVFLIMICGIMLSWFLAGWSFLWNIRNLAIEYNVSYRNQFVEELKFLAKCSNKKIIKRRKISLETIKSNSTDS
ncbi:glutamate receptor ionotropic, kainate 2-like isoform X1 [Polyergus mexicanus]|uniref:glutamate receptor ionotropic, kainate 2-like isoform X1 n=2 Tax=Polyergus mexicanus TaxID=615972 RepID=UPI0038B42F6B